MSGDARCMACKAARDLIGTKPDEMYVTAIVGLCFAGDSLGTSNLAIIVDVLQGRMCARHQTMLAGLAHAADGVFEREKSCPASPKQN